MEKTPCRKLRWDDHALEVNHHFKNSGSLLMMISPYHKKWWFVNPYYKKWWLDFQGYFGHRKKVLLAILSVLLLRGFASWLSEIVQLFFGLNQRVYPTSSVFCPVILDAWSFFYCFWATHFGIHELLIRFFFMCLIYLNAAVNRIKLPVTLPETNNSHLKIVLPKRKRSYSNHPFSGAKMFVSGILIVHQT